MRRPNPCVTDVGQDKRSRSLRSARTEANGRAGLGLAWTAGRVGKAVVYGAIGLALVPVAAVALMGFGVVLAIGALLFPGVLLLGLAVVLVRAFSRRPEPHYHAHLAVEEETEDMVMGGEEGMIPWGEGVMLGVHYGRVLGVAPGFEGRREMGHFLVAGPSRSGKGFHLVANLLMWQGSTMVLDVKGELYGLTSAARSHLGNDVLILDPSGRGHRYDPFAELSYSSEALKRAVELIMEPDRGRDPVFAQRGAAALYAAAVGARIEGMPTLPYVRELTAEGPTRFVEHLSRLGDPGVRRALVDFLSARPEEMGRRDFREDRFLSSTWSTMTARLGPVLAEGVLKMTGGNDFMAADLVKRPTTLYLMFHESELEYTKKVFQVVMLSLVTGLIRHGDLEAGQEGMPLLVALDEAGRTPIPKLDDLVSTISGRGMSAAIYVQDLGQLESAYGRAGAQTIRSNCNTQIYYRPTDYDTASHISRMRGKTSVEDIRAGSGGNHSTGYRERELLTPDELMREMDPTTVIAFAGKKPPIPAHRLEWFNLIPGATEYMRHNPPTEPPGLPVPEVVISNGKSAEAPNFASTSRPPRAPIPGLDSQRAGGGEGGSQEEGIAPAPADLSFLCDPFADYEETSVPTAQKEAAEAVAEGFIRSAYGYTGTDADAYEEEIDSRVVEDCFWGSEAGEDIDASEEIVRQGGEANAPSDRYYFEGFVGYYVNGEERVHSESGAEYLRVYGHAVWVSREARAEASKASALAGFQQGITLTKRVGEQEWKVAYGESVSAYPSSDYEHAIDEKIEEIAAGE